MRILISILIAAVLLVPAVAFAEDVGVIPSKAYDGNMLQQRIISITALTDEGGAAIDALIIPALSDASATYSTIVLTKDITLLRGFILADKGCTLQVFPMPIDNFATTANASETLTIADGGVSVLTPWGYTSIGAPRAKILVTKTEAGTMASFILTHRGEGN